MQRQRVASIVAAIDQLLPVLFALVSMPGEVGLSSRAALREVPGLKYVKKGLDKEVK